MTAVNESADAETRATFPVGLTTAGVAIHVVRSRRSYIVADIETDSLVTARPRHTAPLRGFRSMVTVPMVHQEQVIGVISVTRRLAGAFSEDEVALLQTFADQAVIAIENVRLFKELQTSNRELTTALDTQTATSDILRVISRSQTDVQPVFDAILTSAARLLDASNVMVFRVDGDILRLGAHHGPLPAGDVPLHRDTVSGRAVLDRQVIHLADAQAEVDEFPEGSALAQGRGIRTSLSVPLMREGMAIGNIQAQRNEVRPFSDQQISLLKTFADQAVIAIENVRLFKELEEKNRALTEAHVRVTEALDQQT